MKKLLSIILGLLCLGAVFACACGEEKNAEAVNLINVEANSVGLMSDIDYYVVPEPAATAKSKAIDLKFSGDLQSLYGGNGYPQAVVVAKNALIGTSILDKFCSSLAAADDWLMDENNTIESIASTIKDHLTEGLTPSINAKNLSRSVIKNCSIDFVSATDSKSDITSFMSKFNEVGDNAFGMPSEEFFVNGNGGTAEYTYSLSIYAPDGAPALGLAPLMAQNALSDAQYHIVDASTIQTFVGGNSPKADICVLPVNLAVKLLGNAQNYKLIGTLTHGNLYLMSKSGEQITTDNLTSLKGKTVGVVNLAQVPGLTFKVILKNYGIEFKEPYND